MSKIKEEWDKGTLAMMPTSELKKIKQQAIHLVSESQKLRSKGLAVDEEALGVAMEMNTVANDILCARDADGIKGRTSPNTKILDYTP